MKKGALMLVILWFSLPVLPFIFSSEGSSEGFGLAMWGFFGFCASIIMLQLVPAVKKILGFAAEAEQNPTPVKERADH